MIRRMMAVLLCLALCLPASGCGGLSGDPPQGADAPPDSPAEQPVPEGMRAIVDMAGRRVLLPEKVETAALIYGVAINFILALGAADRLIAINASWSIYGDVEPKLKEADTVGQGAVDLEKLASLKPDVFIHRANDLRSIEAVEALGIPVVAVMPESTEQILSTLTLLGEVFGLPERAEELTDYYYSKMAFAKELVGSIPEAERRTAIMMGSAVGRVAGGDMLQSAMIEAAGGVSLTKDIRSGQTWPTVGTEVIFDWNPDFIFCTNSKSSEYTPEGLMADPFWSELSAVRNGRILKMPSSLDSWEYPGVVTCLGFLWMLSQMYPERYPEEAFFAEVDAFYELAFGMTFERDYLGY